MEYVTYSKESGFNIVNVNKEESVVDMDDGQTAEMMSGQDSICLDPVEEFDEIILKRIRGLLNDSTQ